MHCHQYNVAIKQPPPKLIAYFVDRHMFLPEDIVPKPRFDQEIERLESEKAVRASQYPTISQLYDLRNQKRALEFELFDKDDRLLGEEYDEDLAKQLKTKLENLMGQIDSLRNRSEIEAIKAREREIEVWNRKRGLNCLSKEMPRGALHEPTILISSPSHRICDDCSLFKNNVNRFFGLSIQLYECTM
ncbi:hypothetical protein CISG_09224 [Coccidioides immitis RMSCC 3703]|uniref:Uncharacterized protein n=1 Tax=Coccidioides immitis RMSCC 3703 TaxID=454286 RepID=A0A0J8R9R9_COCIT|nr:hypothetical protein CISG_09224 [Coccidioides immitis RMSCC 3703]